MNQSDQWDKLLDRGEKIIWQGRPDGEFSIKDVSIVLVFFGFFFAGFAVFWVAMASQASILFSLFGLPFVAAGFFLVANGIFGRTFRRRRSWYTLTDRRAFIATNFPFHGRRLKSYSITEENQLELVDGRHPSVYFDKETRRGNKGNYEISIEFENLADGREVYALLRGIQTGERKERSA
ncbi:MAG: aspartate carbamoyltransferase catalytic subunit [Ruegeria sp.]